jgi:uncharacterized protein (TIGR00725 family)
MAVCIAVAGTGQPDPELADLAERAGRALASGGAVLVCGGLGGVMEAACRGARAAGGLTVGLLPGADRAAANPHVDLAIPTGLGEARNVLVARAGAALVAIGGGYGTLSEIAFALKDGTPVVGLRSWDIDGVQAVADPDEAAALALQLAEQAAKPPPPAGR